VLHPFAAKFSTALDLVKGIGKLVDTRAVYCVCIIDTYFQRFVTVLQGVSRAIEFYVASRYILMKCLLNIIRSCILVGSDI